jgi:3-oxoacyl-[acyl-carrier protein] reductase
MQSDLEGRSILITGASGGIGSAVAATLAEEGADCFLHSLSNPDAARLQRNELQLAHPFSRFRQGQADLRQEHQVEELFLDYDEWSACPYGLVVNAGVWPSRSTPLHTMGLDQWRQTLEVNLTGAFLSCREFLRVLSRRQAQTGAIVLVGSTAGIYGEEGHADYAASKAALLGLTLSLKNEIVRFVPRGRVNLVHPGWVDTPMARDSLQDESLVSRVTATMALRKVAQPVDVAAMVTFLLSEKLAGHLTGLAVPIAGGMEGRLLHVRSD